MDNGLSNAEVALMANRDGNGNYGGGLLWFFALLLLAGGNWGLGGNNSAGLYEGLANQTTTQNLANLGVQLANGNLTLVQAINDQTTSLLQQNNTNLINAIQGFNAVQQSMTTQTNTLAQQIAALSAQMNECCCSIKTQMLQDKYDESQTALLEARNQASNAAQSQYLLSQMGKWVANATEAATA